MKEFSISVIIPAYNSAAYLAEALASVRQQTSPAQEIIVVDDGSTDNTARLVRRFPHVQYVYQVNSGPAAARNTGLRLARGNVFGFLDADDLWPANKLELQTACLRQSPTTEIVIGAVQCLKLVANAAGEPGFERFSAPSLMTSLGSALVRRSAFEQIGGFDPSLWHSEDVDWFLRAREENLPTVVLPDVTLFYRFHLHNMSRNKPARDSYFLRGLKYSLERRRQRAATAAVTHLFSPSSEWLSEGSPEREV